MNEDICQVVFVFVFLFAFVFVSIWGHGVVSGGVYHQYTHCNDNDCEYHQVRLNFEEVEILDPDSTGACRTDYMHVTGGVSQVPVWLHVSNSF